MRIVLTIIASCVIATCDCLAFTAINTRDAGRFVALPDGTSPYVSATNSFGSYLMGTNRVTLNSTTLSALSSLCEGVWERRYYMSEGQHNDWSEDFGPPAIDKTRIRVVDSGDTTYDIANEDFVPLTPWAPTNGEQRVWCYSPRALYWHTNIIAAANTVLDNACIGWSRYHTDGTTSKLSLGRAGDGWSWSTNDFEVSSRGFGKAFPALAQTTTPDVSVYRGTLLPIGAAEYDDVIYASYGDEVIRNLPRELWEYLFYGEDAIRAALTNNAILGSVERVDKTIPQICEERFGPIVGSCGSETNITAFIHLDEEGSLSLKIGHELDRQQLGALGQMLALTDRTVGFYPCRQSADTNSWRFVHDTHYITRRATTTATATLSSEYYDGSGAFLKVKFTPIRGSDLSWTEVENFVVSTTNHYPEPNAHALIRSHRTFSECAAESSSSSFVTMPDAVANITAEFLLQQARKFDRVDGTYFVSLNFSPYSTPNDFIVQGIIGKDGEDAKDILDSVSISISEQHEVEVAISCSASRKWGRYERVDGFATTLDPENRETHPGTEGFSTGRVRSFTVYPIVSYAALVGTNADNVVVAGAGMANELSRSFEPNYMGLAGVRINSRADLDAQILARDWNIRELLRQTKVAQNANTTFGWDEMNPVAYASCCSGGVWIVEQDRSSIFGTMTVSGGAITSYALMNDLSKAVTLPETVAHVEWRQETSSPLSGLQNCPDAPSFAADGKIALPYEIEWDWRASGAIGL